MAAKSTGSFDIDTPENISDIDVAEEMQNSFLEYAYSVIYSRALPDARDGLKPVQRRILFQMDEMGLTSQKGHVKSARVVGEVMGKLHPHGDTAIYDAVVRLAQPFTMRLPLIDGHGNFGSLDDGPAAPRYTEVRLAWAASAMTESLDEDVVDFVPNYDNQFTQPEVLPAAFPNLLVNGASGIAVGMATNMAPHNLVEVISAARMLLENPKATLGEVMEHIPGPDFPLGGVIVGLDGIRDAYATGRGSFKTRARVTIEHVTARKMGIVVTELPYLVGPEKVIEKIRDAVNQKRIDGISDITDLTDRKNGLKLIIEIKNGFNPQAVLDRLYRYTPLEESFSINNVALVDGAPRTMTLLELLHVYLGHRVQVTIRRTKYRLQKRQDRLHLVEGLLIAILDIDEVIQVIRTSDEAEQAKTRLKDIFELSDIQADYILELRLRRLTKFSRIELEQERDQLRTEIAALTELLASETLIRSQVSKELALASEKFGTPRRTMLTEQNQANTLSAKANKSSTSLEIVDSPCLVLVSATGRIVRIDNPDDLVMPTRRTKHDAIHQLIKTTTRGALGVITSTGRLIRFSPTELPVVPANSVQMQIGIKLRDAVGLSDKKEQALFVVAESETAPIALATELGVVKRVAPGDWPQREEFSLIQLKSGDKLVAAALATDYDELVFVTNTAQLLRYSAGLVRPQGKPAGGMAGISLANNARVIYFSSVSDIQNAVVATVSTGSDTLPGTENGRGKLSALADYPTKGRATGGVRCHSFLKGEDQLSVAWVGTAPALAYTYDGTAKNFHSELARRDASGQALDAVLAGFGSALAQVSKNLKA